LIGYKTPSDWYDQQSFPDGWANILESAAKRFPGVLKVA